MNRYVIKFSKEGILRYISHLDLLRLFKRSFKRVGIKLLYSQGFNPHPKMSFAQPLSLGYSSTGEYLEFETTTSVPAGEILTKINSIMPEGILILSCDELTEGGKTLAALTEYADYELSIPLENSLDENVKELIDKYMHQEQIKVLKHQRKSGKDIEIDIKPLISEIDGTILDNNNKLIMLTVKLAAGSNANLSPEMILTSFFNFAEMTYDRAKVFIKRTEIYFSNN